MSRRSGGGITFQDLVAWDVNFLWAIQDKVFHWPWLDRNMASIISKQPWNDIGLIVWLVSLVGCFELGVKHFWVVVTNLGISYLLNRLIGARRPVEYDVRLQPTTDLHPDSYGFPSVESHMAVVVIGHIFRATLSWLVLLFGVPLVLLIGFSRIYSRARFPHQIVASYVSGIVGLIVGIHYCEVLGGGFHNLSHHIHGVYVGIAVFFFMGNLALNMENNDSRLLYISKAEFVRVIRGIMYSSTGEGGTGGSGAISRDNDDDGDGDGEHDAFLDANGEDRSNMGGLGGTSAWQGKGSETPRSSAIRRAREEHSRMSSANTGRARARANRKDSFYFLQKQLQARAGEGGSGTLTQDSPRSTIQDNAL